ncbi:PREDICTED: IQ domain-containing protein F1-like [Elephantulus edwardii]|uniref:IQ domain-containing protein F1-like n=1 Tax=Elephantulus edwardii TaxID=28737 RepID=UPI0003F0D83F|nr:PREDICTED: IQ domain-containing protein F1-like [Elephantulus edwardii]
MGIHFCKEGHLILIEIEGESQPYPERAKKKNPASLPKRIPETQPSKLPSQKKQKKPPSNEAETIKIQAWWRGTLVRRTLLHAALQAWIIQNWWRQTLARLVTKRRRAKLEEFVCKEWAVVRLQSWFRMWLVRRRYCRLLNAVCFTQACWRGRNAQTFGPLHGNYQFAGTQLRFEIEILLPSLVCRMVGVIPFPIKN